MATETLNQLIASLQTKQKEWSDVVNKGHDMTIEDLEKSKTLKGEVLDMKNRVDAFNGIGDLAKEAKAVEDWLTKPVNRMVHVDRTEGTPQSKGGMELIGSTDAGHVEINYRGTKVDIADEVGAGVWGEKTWKALQTTEYKNAFCKFIRKKGDDRHMALAEMKTLEEGLDDQGGYAVPIDVLTNRIVSRKPTPNRLAGMASQLTTGREYVEMIKLNYATDNIYSTGFRVTKTGENPSSATAAQVTDTNLFGTIKIPVHTFMIRGLLTNNQIEDSAFDMLGWMAGKFGETTDLLKDDKLVNGIGKQEPYGLVAMVAGSAAGQGTDDPKISYVVSGDANTVTPDGLMNLALDVPEQYEDGCKFFFNKVSTFKAIRTLKDLNDRYLFGMGTADSGLATPTRPTDLIGYPYVYSGLFPNIAAGNFPIFFGDLSGYQMVDRLGFSIQILRELYAETNAVSVLGRVRFGGQVVEPWKLRAQKISA